MLEIRVLKPLGGLKRCIGYLKSYVLLIVSLSYFEKYVRNPCFETAGGIKKVQPYTNNRIFC